MASTGARAAHALVLEAGRQLVPRAFDLPEIGPDDGILRVEACGLCGTDHEQYTGKLHLGVPFVPGHETVGVVEELGERAAAKWGVSVGDRVALDIFQSCRECDACLAGDSRHCVRNGMATTYGFQPTSRAPGLWGGYATHQYLACDSVLLPVPDGVDATVATLFNPMGAGIRWAVTLPGTKAGDGVAVLGPGIRGLSAACAAKEAGAEFVMVTGYGERDHPRLELARSFGADLVVDVAEEDPARAYRKASGTRGANVVVDVTANAPTALAQAVAIARPEGTVVLAGLRGEPSTPGFDADHVVLKELRLIGTLGVDTDSYRRALDLLASGRYPFAELPRTVADLHQAEDLLITMAGEAGPPPVHGVIAPGSAS
jgi:alcohol dehydrogenase